MDGSEPAPDAEALIGAINEALTGQAVGLGAFGDMIPFLFAIYAAAMQAGFHEQRAFEITLIVLNYALSRIPPLPDSMT